jgi:hypothetical protein
MTNSKNTDLICLNFAFQIYIKKVLVKLDLEYKYDFYL